jgi:hypothetical protein
VQTRLLDETWQRDFTLWQTTSGVSLAGRGSSKGGNKQVLSPGLYRTRQHVETPEYLTSSEAAKILRISVDSVVRKFQHYPGVINLGTEERRFKRRYRVLRIPMASLQKFILECRARR